MVEPKIPPKWQQKKIDIAQELAKQNKEMIRLQKEINKKLDMLVKCTCKR